MHEMLKIYKHFIDHSKDSISKKRHCVTVTFFYPHNKEHFYLNCSSCEKGLPKGEPVAAR